jgi:hypothetical protein
LILQPIAAPKLLVGVFCGIHSKKEPPCFLHCKFDVLLWYNKKV